MPAAHHMNLYSLLTGMSEVTDLVSRQLLDHHKKVSLVAASIGEALGLETASIRELAMAGIVHDIGGLSLRSRLQTLEFDTQNPEHHCLPGYLLLAGFKPFARIARLVRFHHVYWQNGRGAESRSEEVPLLSHIIHLADRVAVLVDPDVEILSQKQAIIGQIRERAGEMFVPEQVEALRQLAAKDVFWFDLTSPFVGTVLQERFPPGSIALDREGLFSLAELFRKLIDFRSRFTATHSSGVAAVAVALAEKAGLSANDLGQMRLAGLLHDIGKLAVPDVILEKKQKLTAEDFAVIRKHPYFSGRILGCIEDFAEIGSWAALHHERLDGSGYPYGYTAADLGAGPRILAVADTFTALTEDRPYRCGIGGNGTNRIMKNMASYSKLDRDFVSLVHHHIEEVDRRRQEAQLQADEDHRRFLADCHLLGAELEDGRCPGKPWDAALQE